jgi:hypothetical protein
VAAALGEELTERIRHVCASHQEPGKIAEFLKHFCMPRTESLESKEKMTKASACHEVLRSLSTMDGEASSQFDNFLDDVRPPLRPPAGQRARRASRREPDALTQARMLPADTHRKHKVRGRAHHTHPQRPLSPTPSAPPASLPAPVMQVAQEMQVTSVPSPILPLGMRTPNRLYRKRQCAPRTASSIGAQLGKGHSRKGSGQLLRAPQMMPSQRRMLITACTRSTG